MSEFRLQLAEPTYHHEFSGRPEFILLEHTDIARCFPQFKKLDCGSLFIYMFRRFGFPNARWDDYKDFAAYLLTTPHPKMRLTVRPCFSNWFCGHFHFRAPQDVHDAIYDWESRPLKEWQKQALEWKLTGEAPSWTEAWISLCNLSNALRHKSADAASFTTICETTDYLLGRKDIRGNSSDVREIERLAKELYRAAVKEYGLLCPAPGAIKRDPEWQNWTDDDPAKPFAAAANAALQDFSRPVLASKGAITAYGPIDHGYDDDLLAEPSRASDSGLPIAAFLNGGSEELDSIYKLLLRAGDGDVGVGIKKVLQRASSHGEEAFL